MSESKEFTKLNEESEDKPEKKKVFKKKTPPKPSKVSILNTNKYSVIYSLDAEEYQIRSRAKVTNLDENKIGLPLAKGLIIIKESF